MNKNKKILIVVLISLFFITGCTKTLKVDKEVVKNPDTGQTLTKNILCKPTDEKLKELYEKYDKETKYDSLPECSKFSVTSGKDEGLWTNVFVKSLAWFIIFIGSIVKNYGLALIIASLIIRLILFPITRKTAIQSELIKKAQPELDKINKKYENKNDQESMLKKTQEITMVYKKYDISPFSGCIYAFLQLPLLFGFLEAIQRVPVIFEGKFLTLSLGMTPSTALANGNFQYIIIVIILALTTYFSVVLNTTGQQNDQTKVMNRTMVVMIVVMSLFMTTALDIYWLTSNLFTVGQNLLVKRSRKVNGKV